jgi:hypothetical protein
VADKSAVPTVAGAMLMIAGATLFAHGLSLKLMEERP